VENIHRYINTTDLPVKEAAKRAVGEIAMPVLTGTLTTMAPFVPLLFWGGIIGKFMFFLPATLIIILTASMVVAFTINPVLAVSFMKKGDHMRSDDKVYYRGLIISSVVFLILGIIFHAVGNALLGNIALSVIALQLVGRFILIPLVHIFQERFFPIMMSAYNDTLSWVLKGRRPYGVLLSIVILFFATIGLLIVRSPKVVFFPDSEPNFVYIYTTMPIGMDLEETDSITKVIERKVYEVIGENNPIVESVISNIAVGASDPQDQDRSVSSHKSKISVAFVEFKDRNGNSSRDYMEKIRKNIKGIPGAEIVVEKEASGPPTGKAINVEISGEDFEKLISLAQNVKQHINSLQIPGIEELKSDVQLNKPELIIKVNRAKANTLGLSNAQVGMTIRTALFGKEVSKYKEEEDEYPIQLRLKEEYRNNIDKLLDMKITYRDMATGGQFRQIPISSVADIEYSYTYGGIKRKNLKRVITVYSNVLSGYNAKEINKEIADAIKSIPLEEGFEISLTGEKEEQKEAADFLSKAFLIAIGLIFLILVSQFNSISKPVIILTQVVFSLIGVLLGFIIFNMDISVVLTGMGVITVAGVVVQNGIIMIDYTDILQKEGMDIRSAIVKAGATRLSPVILTAASTILGLIPLAVSMNINFYTLFAELNPQIYFGGDTASFWGPLACTIIFGLAFATFLTLVIVPAMYLITYNLKHKTIEVKGKLKN
jgi:multidrug efflux pump subunit AcrB